MYLTFISSETHDFPIRLLKEIMFKVGYQILPNCGASCARWDIHLRGVQTKDFQDRKSSMSLCTNISATLK